MSVIDSEKIGSESAIQDKEVQGRHNLTLKFPDDEKPQPFNELEIENNSEVQSSSENKTLSSLIKNHYLNTETALKPNIKRDRFDQEFKVINMDAEHKEIPFDNESKISGRTSKASK